MLDGTHFKMYYNPPSPYSIKSADINTHFLRRTLLLSKIQNDTITLHMPNVLDGQNICLCSKNTVYSTKKSKHACE